MKKLYLLSLVILCGLFFSAQAVNITFQVEMTAVPAEGVWIWIPNYGGDTWEQMSDDDSDLIYTIVLDIDPGAQLWYSYWVSWEEGETIPAESRFEDANFRFLVTPDSDYIVPVVGYGENQDPLPEKVDVIFQVELGGDSVLTNGMWMVIKDIPSDPWPWGEMTSIGGDVFDFTWHAFVNQTMRYTYVYSGDWSGEESVPEECNFGSPTAPERLFEGTDVDLVMPVTPFGECTTVVDFTSVTFQVDMSNKTVGSGEVVWVVFYDGSYPEMTETSNDIYTLSMNFLPGDEIVYYYSFGTEEAWEDEVVPTECSDAEGYRTYTVTENDVILAVDCFSGCGLCPDIYTFNMNIFLEGPFDGTTMSTDLHELGALPADQPYNVAPWNYDGFETLSASIDADIVDWLYIEFRETNGDASTATSDKFLSHQAALLLADGSIVQPDGSSLIDYEGFITENLYVIIHHRNHISAMSATPMEGFNFTYVFDFTTDISKAYQDGQKAIGNGKYGLTGGNSNGDGTVGQNDKDIGWSTIAGSSGYHGGDLNLDTQVNNADKTDLWEENVGTNSEVP